MQMHRNPQVVDYELRLFEPYVKPIIFSSRRVLTACFFVSENRYGKNFLNQRQMDLKKSRKPEPPSCASMSPPDVSPQIVKP